MNIHLCHQGRQLGSFSKEQVETMLKAGVIADSTLAWTSGLTEWKALHEVLQPDTPPPVPQPQTVPAITPSGFPTGHPNYVEGNGSRELPFVIHTSNTIRSAHVQREIIDGIYRQGIKESASCHYSKSLKGLPGNGDLCEYRFAINGRETSVWFDLYLVTQQINDPRI